jgi:hypothetical protein
MSGPVLQESLEISYSGSRLYERAVKLTQTSPLIILVNWVIAAGRSRSIHIDIPRGGIERAARAPL